MFVPLYYHQVGRLGWYYIFILLLMAWLSFRSRDRIDRIPVLPSRTRHFISTIVILVFLLWLTVFVARAAGVTLYPRVTPSALQIAAGILVTGGMVAFMRPLWKQAVATGHRRLHFFMPQSATEKALWVGVSLAAGIGEESAYRGLLYILMLTLTGHALPAALLAALVFALGHGVQSRASMVIIFGFSLVFQAIALWTGALYVSIGMHFVFDVVAGFTYSRLGKAAGYRALGDPSPST